ncbi:phosphatidylserine decarboxylase family protein [bacterium]|nr:phosphatidylserine decarboxylase family protein [bacterium]
MSIAKEGFYIIGVFGAIAAAFLLISYLTGSTTVKIFAGVLCILFILVVFFFRDPERNVPLEENAVIAPADGKIILIEEVDDNEYLNNRAKIVSIFMSVFNVHINRVPITGTVEYLKYNKGKFLPAFTEASSLKNENYAVGISNGNQKVLFRQIAGLIARRIVNNLKLNQSVKAGQRFGMIKFGSRLDIIMPLSTQISVSLNQKVKGGETIIGIINNEKN